ncbi:MAG: ABC transporter substrate-binding protein [Anaerolineae bacterium]|nr:ABC transporter substrate-binding protein [Anaerolineae bacterium]
MKTHARLLTTFILSLVWMLTACRPSSHRLETIDLAVGYIPNVQFAPFYVAMEKGFFEDEGIDINLIYGYEIDGVSLVGAGEYQFAVASGEQVLLARDKELPVVYVMNWYDEFPVGITVLKNTGIDELRDLRGKTIGTPALQGASYIGMEALLHAAELTEDDVQVEVIGYAQVELLSTGQVDAAVVYLANEPVQLEAAGYDVTSFHVSDYSELVANGLVTSADTIQNQPELVKRMVRATFRGMQYAADHPEEAYAICLLYVENLPEQPTGQQYDVLTRSIAFWSIEDGGNSEIEQWQNTDELLRNLGMITKTYPLESIFTNQFLP